MERENAANVTDGQFTAEPISLVINRELSKAVEFNFESGRMEGVQMED